MQARHSKRTGFLLMLIAGLLIGCGEARDERSALDKAAEHYAEGRFRAASIEAKNALQQEADNAQARSLLGRSYEKLGQAELALKELREARRLTPDDTELQAALISALVQTGDADGAVELSLEGLSDTDAVVARVWQALAWASLDAPTRARTLIEEALSLDPEHAFALTASARLAHERDEPALARRQLDRLFAVDKDAPAGLELLGDLALASGNGDEAIEVWQRLLSTHGFNQSVATKLAELQLRLGRLEALERTAEQLQKHAPKLAMTSFVSGVLMLEQNKPREALARFEQVLVSNEDHLPTILYLGQTHLALDNAGQAESYARRALNLDNDASAPRLLLARVLLAAGDSDEAEQQLLHVIDSGSADPLAYRILASLYFSEDRVDEAFEIVARMPQALETQGEDGVRAEPGEGNRALDVNLASGVNGGPTTADGDAHARVVGVLTALGAGELDQALQQAEAFVEAHPDEATPKVLLAQVHRQAGRDEQSLAVLTETSKRFPDHAPGTLMLARLHRDRGEVAAARRLYTALLRRDPGSLSASMELAILEAEAGNRSAMLERLDTIMREKPGAVQPALMRSRVYLSDRDPVKAREVLDKLGGASATDPRVQLMRAEIDIESGKPASAKPVLTRLVDRFPSDARVHALLATTLAATGELGLAIESLSAALRLDPERSQYLASLASMQKAMGQEREHEVSVARLRRIDAAHPYLAALDQPDREAPAGTGRASQTGQSSDRSPGQASGQSSGQSSGQAVAAGRSLDEARRLWRSGQREEAVVRLQDWVESHPDDLPVRQTLAQALVDIGRTEAAIEQYRTILAVDADNTVALNNLAWHLREESPVEALGFAQQAARLYPDSASILDTLAVLQYRNRELDAAKQSIRRAVELMPTDPTLAYHAAMIDAARGDAGIARTALERLLREHADFPQRIEAYALLERLQGSAERDE